MSDKDYIMQSLEAQEGESFTIPGEAREIEYDYYWDEVNKTMMVRASYLVPDGWGAIQ